MYCHAVIVVGVGVQPEMPVERTYVSTMERKVDDVLSVNESVMLYEIRRPGERERDGVLA